MEYWLVFLLFLLLPWVCYKVCVRLVRIPLIDTKDVYIFITGCDSGFGHAIARKLDHMGCFIIAGCLTEKGATELRKCCSLRLRTVQVDVTDHQSVLDAYTDVIKILPHGKGLWGVLNNAGIMGKIGLSDWLKTEDYKQVMDVNTFGMIDVTNTFLPLVKKSRGRIVNTASILGHVSIAGLGPYCASKHAVEAYSDALRREMSCFDVSVHIIEPGFHKTHLTDPNVLTSALSSTWTQAPRHVQREYGQGYFTSAVEALQTILVTAPSNTDISGVVNAYTHALLAKFPRCRYRIGIDSTILSLPLLWLPIWVGDRLLEIVYWTKEKPEMCKK